MAKRKFNRKYTEYQPSTNTTQGPPTQRICRPSKCQLTESTKSDETET